MLFPELHSPQSCENDDDDKSWQRGPRTGKRQSAERKMCAIVYVLLTLRFISEWVPCLTLQSKSKQTEEMVQVGVTGRYMFRYLAGVGQQWIPISIVDTIPPSDSFGQVTDSISREEINGSAWCFVTFPPMFAYYSMNLFMAAV